jgi:nucleoside-diphosphate-sugar epimerase
VNDPNNAYGYNKRQAEIVLQNAQSNRGFPGTILRLPAVYGPYDYQAREWYFIRRFIDGRKRMLLPDYGMSVYQREYAGNIAEQLNFLMNRPESIGKIYNSGHRHFHHYKDLINLAATIQNTEISLYGIPANEMPWSVPLTEPKLFVSSTARLEQLGYEEPFNLEAGLKETIDYFKENPINNWSFSERSKVNLFDYILEDKIIDEKAVKLNE